MAKRKSKGQPSQPEARRPADLSAGQRTYRTQGKRIVTHTVGALPILNRLLERMRLQEFFARHLPAEDDRTKVDTPRVVLLLLRNLLVSREPVYTPAARWAPAAGLAQAYGTMLNDRGVSFHAAVRSLAFKWQRIMFHCWQTRQPDDDDRHLARLYSLSTLGRCHSFLLFGHMLLLVDPRLNIGFDRLREQCLSTRRNITNPIASFNHSTSATFGYFFGWIVTYGFS